MKTIKYRFLPAFLVLVAMLSISCSLMSTVANGVANKVNNAVGNAVTGGGDAGTVAQLWPDVPKMDGLTQEDLQLPLAAKLALTTVMNASTGGKGTLNFIAFTTTQNTQAVVDYYTVDRMTSQGWNGTDQAGCNTGNTDTNGSTPSVSGGVCFFTRTMPDGKQAMLGMFIGQDNSTSKTQVFFMRVEADAPTPTPKP